VPALFSYRQLVRQQLGREQPFDEAVVTEVAVVTGVAVPPGGSEHARDEVRLEHGAGPPAVPYLFVLGDLLSEQHGSRGRETWPTA
jgi:hypothetical protein